MENTRHLGTYGVIIRKDKILLVKKSRGAYTGKYDLPGGSFEHGETPEETLLRELKEETNVTVEDYHILCATSALVDWTRPNDKVKEHMHHIGIIYSITIKDDSIIKEDPDGLDSLGAKWLKIDEITKDMVSPIAYQMIIKIKAQCK